MGQIIVEFDKGTKTKKPNSWRMWLIKKHLMNFPTDKNTTMLLSSVYRIGCAHFFNGINRIVFSDILQEVLETSTFCDWRMRMRIGTVLCRIWDERAKHLSILMFYQSIPLILAHLWLRLKLLNRFFRLLDLTKRCTLRYPFNGSSVNMSISEVIFVCVFSS